MDSSTSASEHFRSLLYKYHSTYALAQYSKGATPDLGVRQPSLTSLDVSVQGSGAALLAKSRKGLHEQQPENPRSGE